MKPINPFVYIPKRYAVALLTFLGICIQCFMNLCLSVAVVDMSYDKIIQVGNQKFVKPAEFQWDSEHQGFLLSLFAFGELTICVTSFLAAKFGGATMVGIGITTSGLISLISPTLFRVNFYIYAIFRVLQGVAEGFTASSKVELLVHWAPPRERPQLQLFMTMGIYVGLMITNPIASYIADVYSWEYVFYFPGLVAIMWSLVWFLFVSNHPEDDKYISASEKLYLNKEIQCFQKRQKLNYPWKEIFTSVPVWVCFNEYFAIGWSYAFVIYCLPVYVKDIYNLQIEEIGVMSTAPNIISFVVIVVSLWLIDYMRNGRMTVTSAYRFYFFCGHSIIILSLIAAAMWRNLNSCVIFFSILRMGACIAETSGEILPVDLAPQYSSFLYGICMSLFSGSCLLSSTLMGFIAENGSHADWHRYFVVVGLFSVWTMSVFYFFGTGECQPWATSNASEKQNTSETVAEPKNECSAF